MNVIADANAKSLDNHRFMLVLELICQTHLQTHLPNSLAKDGPPDRLRKQIVEEEMHLRNPAHAVPAAAVHGDHRLHGQLHRLATCDRTEQLETTLPRHRAGVMPGAGGDGRRRVKPPA